MNLKKIAITLCLIGLGLGLQGKDKPNVLFISVDDLNDFPSFAKIYPDAVTPHMDKLASQGIVFDKAHSQCPMCGPSRNSLMSGLHPTTVGSKKRLLDHQLQDLLTEHGTKMLHEYFADYGYTTLAVGKICHYHVPEGSVDASGGRGEFNAGLGRLGVNWNSKKTNTDWAVVDLPDEEFPDYQAADWAIDQLQQEHEDPFLLMVGFLRPHVPWYVTQKWFDLYDPEKLTLPIYKKDDLNDVPAVAREINYHDGMPRTDWAIENNQWRNIVHAYLASTSFADAQVGRVLDALEASPYRDNTIIVLWSDHGYHLGEKNNFQKHSLWERSSHVPLVMAGPGIAAGSRSQRVVSLLDIYPTLLDLCGLPANAKNEGNRLLPLIQDPELEWPYPAYTAWKSGNYALQTERYRYIRYQNGEEELYDHEKDPNEWTNLANNPELSGLKAKLASQLDAMNFKDTINWK